MQTLCERGEGLKPHWVALEEWTDERQNVSPALEDKSKAERKLQAHDVCREAEEYEKGSTGWQLGTRGHKDGKAGGTSTVKGGNTRTSHRWWNAKKELLFCYCCWCWLCVCPTVRSNRIRIGLYKNNSDNWRKQFVEAKCQRNENHFRIHYIRCRFLQLTLIQH